jgi:hypothetical protein
MKEFIKKYFNKFFGSTPSACECGCDCKKQIAVIEEKILRMEEQLNQSNIIDKIRWGVTSSFSNFLQIVETQKNIAKTLDEILKKEIEK